MILVHRDSRDRGVRQEPQGHQARLDHRDSQVLRGLPACQDLLVVPDLQVPRVPEVTRDYGETLALQEPQDLEDNLVQQVHKDSQDLLVR